MGLLSNAQRRTLERRVQPLLREHHESLIDCVIGRSDGAEQVSMALGFTSHAVYLALNTKFGTDSLRIEYEAIEELWIFPLHETTTGLHLTLSADEHRGKIETYVQSDRQIDI